LAVDRQQQLQGDDVSAAAAAAADSARGSGKTLTTRLA